VSGQELVPDAIDKVHAHRDSATFTLMRVPNALAAASECAARIEGLSPPDPLPLAYGTFRMTSYGIELP
jgi:hypothetical protein